MSETCNQEILQVKSGREKNGRFQKGVSGNPKGNIHTKDLDRLIEALDDRSKREGFQDFDGLVAERAMKHKEVLIACIKKVYPERVTPPIINLYTQIWNNLENKGKDVDANGRVHIRKQEEVPA